MNPSTHQLILSLQLRTHQDVVQARQRARQIARGLGFGDQDQIRVATAVSELARNVVMYARRGMVEFGVEREPTWRLSIRVHDPGPGIADVQAILDGRYTSSTGMGLGLTGVRRLMDAFSLESKLGEGTEVRVAKALPPSAPAPTMAALSRIGDELARGTAETPVEVIVQQNQELIRALSELEAKEAELQRVNRELEETNRGVVALYAELDEKAEALRKASDARSSFLSSLSHELRTPLNSVLSLSRLLLERVDGPLTEEQGRQVTFIRRSAESLSELIDDLLDIAKIAAGRSEVRPKAFSLEELFGKLRGMMRPLAAGEEVALVLAPAAELPPLYTDEGKLAQVLRNLVSNALKYTEHGEVRVWAERAPGGCVRITVRDTGIGIPQEHQERIFEEFAQVEGAHQRKVKGTGLGLPLARKLSQLLGGTLGIVHSKPGVGSTFALTFPAVYPEAKEVPDELELEWRAGSGLLPVLLVENDPHTIAVCDKLLEGAPYAVVPARTIEQARRVLEKVRPVAALVDIALDGERGWDFLSEIKSGPYASTPVAVVTVVDEPNRAVALGAEAFHLKPITRDWLLPTLARWTGVRASAVANRETAVLVIDDDEVSRDLLRRALGGLGLEVMEASSGPEGLARARQSVPRIIFLDVVMPDMNGFEVLDALEQDATTAPIPVVISSSAPLTDAERARMSRAAAFLPKASLTAQTAGEVVKQVLGRAARGEQAPSVPASNAAAQQPGDIPAGGRKRLLLVEDNPDAREAMRDLLEDWGHAVETESDGRRAAARILELRPDIALVDIGLPGVDGYQVARQVRQAAEGAGLMLIALTGYGGSQQRKDALDAGFNLHLVKPVDPDELIRVLSGERPL